MSTIYSFELLIMKSDKNMITDYMTARVVVLNFLRIFQTFGTMPHNEIFLLKFNASTILLFVSTDIFFSKNARATAS